MRMNFIDLNIAPGRLIIKNGLAKDLAGYVAMTGERPLYIGERKIFELLNFRTGPATAFFNGEATVEEVERLLGIAETSGSDIIVGLGGGKALDTGKLVAYHKRLPYYVLPTSAATCAAMTSMVALYEPSGRFREYQFVSKAPDLVLLDPRVLLSAPLRLTLSGVADALAKYYEGCHTALNSKDDGIESVMENAGLMFAQRIVEVSRKWIQSVNRRKSECDSEITEEANRTRVFERMSCDMTENCMICGDEKLFVELLISSIVYAGLSGSIGGMTLSVTLAHSIANGLTSLTQARRFLHGELVSIGMKIMSKLFPEPSVDREVFPILEMLNIPSTVEEIERVTGTVISEKELESVATMALADFGCDSFKGKKINVEEIVRAMRVSSEG